MLFFRNKWILTSSSHMNAVDKDENGDYLVSGSHVGTVYKVAGLTNPRHAPGTIIWRLGGKNNTFASSMSPNDGSLGFNFSYQHDARWLSCNDQEEIISFLDK